MNVVFRVDSGKAIGLGHLMRCLAIANSLKKKKVNCIFLTSNKNSSKIIKEYRYRVIELSKGKSEKQVISKINSRIKIDFLIVDSKRKSISKLISDIGKKIKIILIDNVSYGSFLTILPGVKEQFGKYPREALVGPEYVLINKFPTKKKPQRDDTILLLLGGSDKRNITKRVVTAFKKSNKKFKVVICLGNFFNYQSQITKLIFNDDRFTIVKNPKNLPELMQKCSLGIFSFGISVYEAVFSKLPILTISHSDENEKSANRMKKYEWFKHIGKYDKINYSKLPFLTDSLLKNKFLLNKMSQAGNIIDGKGADRIAEIIINS